MVLKKNSLLIVDDEPDVLDYVKDLFINLVEKIHIAQSGSEALTIAKNTQVDLAIIDQKMPNMGGFELIEALKVESPDTVCLIMTAFGDKTDVQKALHFGVYDYFDKPFDAKWLEHQVLKALDEYNIRSLFERITDQLLELHPSHYKMKDFKKFSPEKKEEVLLVVLASLNIRMVNFERLKVVANE